MALKAHRLLSRFDKSPYKIILFVEYVSVFTNEIRSCLHDTISWLHKSLHSNDEHSKKRKLDENWLWVNLLCWYICSYSCKQHNFRHFELVQSEGKRKSELEIVLLFRYSTYPSITMRVFVTPYITMPLWTWMPFLLCKYRSELNLKCLLNRVPRTRLFVTVSSFFPSPCYSPLYRAHANNVTGEIGVDK